jgi:hypothetical protein
MKMTVAPALAVLIGTAASPVAAQGSPGGDIAACRAISDDARRLACFDRAAGSLEQTRADDAHEAALRTRERQRADFGLEAPPPARVAERAREEEPAAPREAASTVRWVRPFGYGFFRIGMADGSEWQTTETLGGFSPAVGDEAVIKAGSLGGYRATIGRSGARAVRIKRLR